MRVAIISDIHGNAIALERVLEDIFLNNISDIYFLGDAINYYPDCNLVLESLRINNIKCILGNHDEMAIKNKVIDSYKNEIYKLSDTLDNLTKLNLEFMKSWAITLTIEVNEKKILMVHGSPNDLLEGYIYPDSDLSDYKMLDYDFVFCGHTHWSMIRNYNNTMFINTGSVGMPRDQGNMLSYVIADFNLNTVSIIKVVSPIKQIKARYKDIVHSSVINLLNRI